MEKIGIGYDSHRLIEGRPLRIGGVTIPYKSGLLGHSDGDVLIHSVIDAILSVSNLPDIGVVFPQTQAKWKNIDSRILLEKANKMVLEKGNDVVSMDSTVILEEPLLNPYIPQMKKEISRILGVPCENIGIKAKTNEGMGFIGRKEGIAAICIVVVTTHPDK